MNKNEQYTLFPIGKIKRNKNEIILILKEEYKDALKGLDEFSHIQVLFWADKFDSNQMRKILVTNPFYAPDKQMGIFSTRSPVRPNPILTTACKILKIDETKGTIIINNIDAEDGTPIIDIKPYYPCLDKISNPSISPDVPQEFNQMVPEEGVSLEE